MKKQNVIAAVGTIAILANLLVPGLAFGQSGSQEATQVIACPVDGGGTAELNFSVPYAVQFDSKVASGDSQEAYDATLSEAIIADAAHHLVVTDTRSGGAENCPTDSATRGFAVTAVMNDKGLTNGNPISEGTAGYWNGLIPSSQFRIITTPQVSTLTALTYLPETTNPAGSGTAADFAKGGTLSNVWYTNPANTAGNLHDVATPVMYDGTGFRTKSNYVMTNTLETAVTLMSTPTSHFNHMATDVVLQSQVPPNQEQGTYTGSLTYTLSAIH